ncbi:MAG: type II toxin-antitoxin system HicB family antitoxin [Polyangiales bacterium]
MFVEQRTFGCAMIVYRAPDVDAWIAHCLDYDVVSQGDTPRHAFEMGREATSMVLVDTLNDGRDPASLPRAPKEDWDRFWATMHAGEKFNSWDNVTLTESTCYAVYFELHAERVVTAPEPVDSDRLVGARAPAQACA